MEKKDTNTIYIVNKRASFEYNLIDKYEAGIVLMGSEIKSIRQGKVNISDAYCYFKDGELYVKNMHISPYDHGGYSNHNPLRDRKLLLHKHELRKLYRAVKEDGFTIVPVKIYINKKGLAKMEIALAKGKKMYDKRESIKKRDIERELGRKFK
ncbi:MAG: SsrA-binding protein [Bacteroidia bacterium]|nr:MAG: SsrA-binding protein [Bacteroidia bacterium]